MSCLYRSLAHFIEGINANQLRNIVCNYLENDPILLDDLKASQTIPLETGMNLQNYISRMRSQNQWGGAIEIKIYCDIFKRNVIVKSIPNRRKIEFKSKTQSKIWDKILWTGNHYEPLKTLIKNQNLCKIRLHKAWYGCQGKMINVTPILRNILKNNNQVLHITNIPNKYYYNLFGDPCPTKQKNLIIKYYVVTDNHQSHLKTAILNEDQDIIIG